MRPFPVIFTGLILAGYVQHVTSGVRGLWGDRAYFLLGPYFASWVAGLAAYRVVLKVLGVRPLVAERSPGRNRARVTNRTPGPLPWVTAFVASVTTVGAGYLVVEMTTDRQSMLPTVYLLYVAGPLCLAVTGIVLFIGLLRR